MSNLHAQIESQQIILSHLQTKISDLEAFYLGFPYQQDGGSSSSNNEFAKMCLAKIMEECKTKKSQVDVEKRGVEDARSKLDFLREIKDKAPFDLDHIVGMSTWNDVVMQHTSTPTEVAKLKKKLVASLSLEPLLEKDKDDLKALIYN